MLADAARAPWPVILGHFDDDGFDIRWRIHRRRDAIVGEGGVEGFPLF